MSCVRVSYRNIDDACGTFPASHMNISKVYRTQMRRGYQEMPLWVAVGREGKTFSLLSILCLEEEKNVKKKKKEREPTLDIMVEALTTLLDTVYPDLSAAGEANPTRDAVSGSPISLAFAPFIVCSPVCRCCSNQKRVVAICY